MSTIQMVWVAMVVVLVSGCGQRAQNKNEPMASEEFFKEIEAPVVVEANTENGKSLPGNRESPAANPGVPALGNIPDQPTIKDIQQALHHANLYEGKVDGVMGPHTKQAIRQFQAQNNLKPDGKVGPKTWAQMRNYYLEAPINVSSSSTSSLETQLGN